MTQNTRCYLKRGAVAFGSLLGLFLVAFVSYALYLETGYYRIPDNQEIQAQGTAEHTGALKLNKTYSAVTYNVGFGAYTPDYTFFMDEGVMKDGTHKTGERARAVSYESALACTQGDIETMRSGLAITGDAQTPDFMLFQEIDTDADRSHHINQVDMMQKAFPGHQAAFASNFHSRYLFYPVLEPHGAVQSGLLTLSSHTIGSALRRSYYITQAWPTKYFDLDRCFLICRIPTEDGRELVLVNSHMSAYDKGGTSREKQLALIISVMQAERAQGNYVVVGGDWNHALFGTVKSFPSNQQVPAWVSILEDKDLPEGFRMVKPVNADETPTCRGVDIPYKKGETYTCIVDGFCVSDNVEAHAKTLDMGFAYSDHNPQFMDFSLKQAG